MWWNRTWLVEYMSSMRKMAWRSCSAVMRYVLIGLFILHSWCPNCQSLFVTFAWYRKKSIVPLLKNIHTLSIALNIKCYYIFKLQCFRKRMYIQIHAYLPKPITYSKLFLWVLHAFYHEWVDMKEASKAVEMLGNFPFHGSKSLSHYTHETLRKHDTVFHGFSEFHQPLKIKTGYPWWWTFLLFVASKFLWPLNTLRKFLMIFDTEACFVQCLIDQLKFTNGYALFILFCRQRGYENRMFLIFFWETAFGCFTNFNSMVMTEVDWCNICWCLFSTFTEVNCFFSFIQTLKLPWLGTSLSHPYIPNL